MNKHLRIGLCGAQGVGKSTLAKLLAKELDLPLVMEQARKATELLSLDGLPNPQENPTLSRAFQELCLVLQVQEETKHRQFISDRTTIDNALYFLMNNAFNTHAEDAIHYYSRCATNAQKYDLVIYVPIEFPIKDDGFRDYCPYNQRLADFYLRCLLKEMRPNNYAEISGTIEERLERSTQAIKAVM